MAEAEKKDAPEPIIAIKIKAAQKIIEAQASSGGHHVEIARLALKKLQEAEGAANRATAFEAEGDALMTRALKAKEEHEKIMKGGK